MAIRKLEDVKPEKPKVKRAYLYSLDRPQGEIFTGDEAIAAALENGWVDTPTKLPELEAAASGSDEGKSKGGGKAKAKATDDDSQ